MYFKGGDGKKDYFLLNVVFLSNNQKVNMYSRNRYISVFLKSKYINKYGKMS